MSPLLNDPTISVFVVRHGRTELNASGKFRGNADPPLDSQGLKDAGVLAKLFEHIPLSAIFTSDKQRATKTAEIISKAKGMPFTQTHHLRALNVGSFSGLERTPENEDALQAFIDTPERQIPGGESLNEFRTRIHPCLLDAVGLFQEFGVPPLVTAHSSVIHEVGQIAHGDHKSVLVQPGGVIALCIKNGKLFAKALTKPMSTSEKSKLIT